MASLEAAIKAQEAVVASPCAKVLKKRMRLIADFSITVAELVGLYSIFLSFAMSKDLYSLIQPPPNAPTVVSWQTRPVASWMVRMSGLCFDLLGLHANTKLKPTRHRAALGHLLKTGAITNSTKRSPEGFLDQCDQMVRLVMSMFRECKIEEKKRMTVMNALSEPEQKKIQMVLDRIKLPPGYEFELDPAEASPVAVFECPPSAAQLAHVRKSPPSWGKWPTDEALAMFPEDRMVEWGSSSTIGDLGFPAHRMASTDSIDGPAPPGPSKGACLSPKPGPSKAVVETPRTHRPVCSPMEPGPSSAAVATPKTPRPVFSFMDPGPSTAGVAHEPSFSRNVKAKIQEPVISEEDALLASAENVQPIDIVKKKTKKEKAQELKEQKQQDKEKEKQDKEKEKEDKEKEKDNKKDMETEKVKDSANTNK